MMALEVWYLLTNGDLGFFPIYSQARWQEVWFFLSAVWSGASTFGISYESMHHLVHLGIKHCQYPFISMIGFQIMENMQKCLILSILSFRLIF